MRKALIILTLFFGCSNKEKKIISEIEIYFSNKEITTIVAVKCDNFTELIDTKKVVIKNSNLFKKLSKISLKNDTNQNLEGDIRVKAIFNYSTNTADTLCISYYPPVMYFNSKSIQFNTELEQLLSKYMYK